MIIQRYLLKEIIITLLAVTSVLLLIFLSNHFIKLLVEVTSGSLSGSIVFKLLLLETIVTLVILLPLGLFIAILVAFGRLYKDSEMVAMAACGISMRKIFRVVLVAGVIVSSVVGGISIFVAPWAKELSYKIEDKAKSSSKMGGVQAGRFNEILSAEGVIYFKSTSDDGDTLFDVFIQNDFVDKKTILTSKKAFQLTDEKTDGQFLVLLDGYRYEWLTETGEFNRIRFAEHGIRLMDPDVAPKIRKLAAKPSAQLLRSDNLREVAELQWRISMPISCLLLALFAVPLSYAEPRQGRYAKIFIGVLSYIIYNNLMGVANTWVEKAYVPVGLGMWWVHVLLLFGIWWMLARQYSALWMLRSLVGKNLVNR